MDDDDDDDDGGASGSDKGMDVDDDESAPTKRVKTNSGGVINKRAPRSNRQMAGMRDEGVSGFFSFLCFFAFFHFFTKNWLIYLFVAIHSCNQASQSWSTSSQYACESRRRRSCHQNQNGKDFLFFHSIIGFLILHSLALSLSSRNIYSVANAKVERHKEDDCNLCYFIFLLCGLSFTVIVHVILFFIGSIYFGYLEKKKSKIEYNHFISKPII